LAVQVLVKSFKIATGVAWGLQSLSSDGKNGPMVLGAIAFDYETLHCIGFVSSMVCGFC
jgi:hypothetical protein